MTNRTKSAQALGLAIALLALSVASSAAGPAGQAAPKAKVNVNTAGQAELESLPRIGPKVAQRIIDFRAKNGPFKRVEDVMKVQGIGEKVFGQIKDLITVGEAVK